ncbi:MAG: histidine kinase [Crocinitomicaceae bacterium]
MKSRLLSTLILLISLTSVHAQEVGFLRAFHNLSPDDGFPNAEIYNVIQDSKGHMWFSTDAGVIRYDGYYFKVFGMKDGLLNNVVFESVEDDFGRIWFITLSNELCYFENGKILPYKFNHLIKDHTKEVTSHRKFLHIDKEGNVYYAMSKMGFIRIDTSGVLTDIHDKPQTYQITRIDKWDIPSFQTGKHVKFAPGQNRGDLPIIYKKNGKTNLIGDFGSGKGANFVRGNDEFSLTIVSETLIDLKRELPLIQNIQKCVVDPNERGVFWRLGIKGIQKYQYLNGELIQGESYLEGKRTTDACWDSEGGMWITTLNHGVFYSPNAWVSYANVSTGLNKNSVTGVMEFQGDMYVASFGGYQKLGVDGWVRKASRSSVSLSSGDSHLLVSNGLYVNVRKHSDYVELPYARDLRYKNGYAYFLLDRVFRYHIETERCDTLYDSYTDLSASKQNFFRTLEVMANDEILLGGRFGVVSLKNGHLTNDHEWSTSFDVTNIVDSKQFGLVVATNNNGIILDGNSSKRVVINTENGLASNKVHCVLETQNGLLLVGTNNGLNYLRKGELKPGLISENQGLTNTDVLSLHENDRFVFVGTNGGLYRLDKALFDNRYRTKQSQVYLETIFVDGERINEDGAKVELPYGTGRLRVRFRTTNYKKWARKRYQYRLSNRESWIDIESPEIVIYKPLGEFDIEVRSEDEWNAWSSPVSILSCEVHVPFWKRWYFIALAVGLAVLLIIRLLYRRQRNIRRKLIMKNEMLSLEQRMQNARMNPHFVFNVLNSIHSFIVFGDKDSAEKYLVKFSELMRNTLNETLEGFISIEDELTILDKYLELEQLRSAQAFDYTIAHSLKNGSQTIPTMIIQPIVENAILHGISGMGAGGVISIQFDQYDDKAIEATVFNNGYISDEQLVKINAGGLNNALGITNKRLNNYNLIYQTEQYGMRTTREKEGVSFKLIIPLIER